MTRDLLYAWWALVAAGFVVCEVLSYVTRGRYAGMRGMMARLVGSGTARFVVLFVGWMWVGWHLFAR